jgi:hypothetical protein
MGTESEFNFEEYARVEALETRNPKLQLVLNQIP